MSYDKRFFFTYYFFVLTIAFSPALEYHKVCGSISWAVARVQPADRVDDFLSGKASCRATSRIADYQLIKFIKK